MTHFRWAMAALVLVGAGPVQALAQPSVQSMNVPVIVREAVGGVCAPLMRSGDVAAAIAAAETVGYIQTADSHLDLAGGRPNARVILRKGHSGRLTISLDYGRVLCSVGIHEAGAAQIADHAAPILGELGMVSVLDVRGGGEPEVVVWRGQGRQAVISPSPVFQPGAEITLSAHF